MSSTSLFRKPFSPKKAPKRKATTISPLQLDAAERSREFGLDYGNAHMSLAESLQLVFDPENGEWMEGMMTLAYNSIIHIFLIPSLTCKLFVFLCVLDQRRSSRDHSSSADRFGGGGGSRHHQHQHGGAASSKELDKLRKVNQTLVEENNMIRVKNEVMLDMLAEVFSELQLETDKNKKK